MGKLSSRKQRPFFAIEKFFLILTIFFKKRGLPITTYYSGFWYTQNVLRLKIVALIKCILYLIAILIFYYTIIVSYKSNFKGATKMYCYLLLD